MSGLKMKYFVLKPEGDDVFAQASRVGMRAYARQLENKDPQYAAEIRKWADDEMKKTSTWQESEDGV